MPKFRDKLSAFVLMLIIVIVGIILLLIFWEDLFGKHDWEIRINFAEIKDLDNGNNEI